MSFLHPALLAAGLACVSLPIIIHFLFRRRRKPVRWGAMRFLMEAYRRQRRRLRLEQLLLLAARCLLVALIAIGLGRPLLQRAGLLGGGSLTLYLLVDNSLASSATDADGQTALERHKKAAVGLLERLDPSRGDRAALIALGGPAASIVLPSSAETDAVARAVDALETTASGMDLEGALSRLGAELADRSESEGPARVVVLSDFLAGSASVERVLPTMEAGPDVGLVASSPAEAGVDNVAVVGVEPLRSVLVSGEREGVQQEQVRVLLRRSGPGVARDAATSVRISLERPDDEGLAPVVGEETVEWRAGEAQREASVSVSVVGGEAGVLVARIDRDAVDADNEYRQPIEVRRRLRVGLAARRRLGVGSDLTPFDAADWVEMALSPGAEEAAAIEVTRVEPAALDASRLAGLDALVLTEPDAMDATGWSRLARFAEDGGLVVVFPPAEQTTHAWTDAMLAAFGVGWTIERETERIDEGVHVGRERGPFGAGRDLLRLLSGEIEELATPVTVWRHLAVRPGSSTTSTLLALEDGSPLVLAAVPGAGEEEGGARRGLLVLVGVAPSFEWTDLPARPLMVALMQELVRQGLGEARGPSVAIAGRAIQAPARATELLSMAPGSSRRVGVSRAGLAEEPIRRTGLWQARDERGAARGVVAVNAEPSASSGDAVSPGEVEAWLGRALPGAGVAWLDSVRTEEGEDVAGSLGLEDAGTGLAAKVLVAAMLVALAELAMARWFSHARVGAEGGGAS